MIIDTQSHYIPAEALRLLEDVRWGAVKPSGLPAQFSRTHPMVSLDARLHEMDRCSVDVAVLSFAPVGPAPDPALDTEIAIAANDGLIAACALNPDRFVALARLPLPNAVAANAELERVRDAECMRGIALLAEATQYRPDLLELEEVWSACSDRAWPVVLHPPAGGPDISDAFSAFGLSSGINAMIGSTLVLARLIYFGVLDRHPKLELIATHLGGVAPFLAERLDSRGKGAEYPFSHYLRNRLYLDNCGYPAGPALRCAIDVVGAQRIVLGSDWPSRPIDECLAPLVALNDADRRAIAGETASRWFNLAQAARA